MASASAAEGYPGSVTPVYFQYLIDELGHGWHTGRALPRSVQDLLTVRAGRHVALVEAAAHPPPAPWTIDVDGRSGGGSSGGGGVIVTKGRRWNDATGRSPHNHPIQRLHIPSGDNTQGMCRDVALPTLGGIAFCKRWHMGYTCFGDCPQAASHHHPVEDIVDKVAAAMEADRATRGGDRSANLTSGWCHTVPASFTTCGHRHCLQLQRKR